jgi:thiamine transport system substrate-binding protein
VKRPAIVLAAVILASSCGGSNEATSVRLIAYESFPTDAENPVMVALAEFTESTGIDVEVVISGDTGTMLSAAELTAGNPEADVIWGIDNTFLSRSVAADIFVPYTANGLDQIPAEFTALVPDGIATPVDYGDVCLNYDIAAFTELNLDPPTSLDDLIEPAYAGLTVVQNPGQSSPGLAFLLATIDTYGDDGWEAYWQALRTNDVLVANGWTEAYYGDFSFAGGDRPIVVSYGSSPPFEVLFAAEPLTEAPTGVVEASCFRQVEFAGILRGTDAQNAAEKLVDFLISERFQREIPMNLFVFPANAMIELLPEFVNYAAFPDAPITVEPDLIDANRNDWIERWTDTVLR